jgi:hypothetical protein
LDSAAAIIGSILRLFYSAFPKIFHGSILPRGEPPATPAGQFSMISAARFAHATSRHLALRELIIRAVETMWAEAQQNAACNAVHDASRLCRWLLAMFADRIGSDQLAGMLGVRERP